MRKRIDINTLPLFMEEKRSFGNDNNFTLDAYCRLKGNVDLAIAYSYLFWPRVVYLNGCYLREKEGSLYNYFSDSEMTLNEQQDVEKSHNHLHMYDLFPYSHPNTPLAVYEHIAELLLEMWPVALRIQYPNVDFHFEYATEPDEYGPTITFWHI